MIRLLAIACATVLVGCSSMAAGNKPFSGCASDAECGENQVCFPEGCGDPGSGLVLEVRGKSGSGQLAQDFLLGDGGFSARIDKELLSPTALTGEFLRNLSPSGDPADRTIYTETVTVKVRGESELIPGVARNYQETFLRPERGTYSLPVGAGRFVVTAQADDRSIPPELTDVSAASGTKTMITFAFASSDGTLTLPGRLLKRIDPGPPPTEIAVKQAAMDLQAFDPATHRPLSQLTQTSSGTTESKGDFVISIAPAAQKLDSIVLVATPRETGALVPSKTFVITRPYPPSLSLELGDFGDPLPQLQGEIVGTTGQPVVGASVYLEGPVAGGGTFRSKVVSTDAKGIYRVDVLPSASGGSYVLTALPPSGSPSGVVQAQVRAIATAGQLAALSPTRVVCPDKITVVGSAIRPDGRPAANATVLARAVEQLKELGTLPLPMGESETSTDESGHFSLPLDPGIYQLDFIPGEDLPRTSRLVTVRSDLETDAGASVSRTIDLKEFPLWKGRKVTGTITLPPNLNTGIVAPAVNATVRYFRVSPVEGRISSLLLGESITNDRGEYTVVLPARPQP